MRIALDAMGTDHCPRVEVQGAVQALREIPGDFTIVLVGDRGRIEEELRRIEDLPGDRLEIVHAAQRIEPGEPPATAVRRKPDSSIVIGLSLQKEGSADAFVSAGSTGAVMAASLFLLRPLPGVDRPPIAAALPRDGEPVLLVDAGAIVDCKPQHLLQFAYLGSIYARDVLGRENPRVGLLNIGEEPEKGNELALETYQLLRRSRLNFIGNIEGRDILDGGCDVVVTDGFAGNILLKFYEQVATLFRGILTREIGKTGVQLDLDRIFGTLDYTVYGGAPLLGVNGISIICHGGSPPRAIRNAIRAAIRAVETNMVGHMRRELLGAAQDGEGEPVAVSGLGVEGS